MKRDFGATDQEIGLFWGLVAIGSLAGSAFAVRNATRWPFGRVIAIAYTIDALVFLPIVFVHNLWAVAFFWALTSGCVMFEFSQIVGFRMRVTPEALVGRMMGAVRVFVLGGTAPGVLALGRLVRLGYAGAAGRDALVAPLRLKVPPRGKSTPICKETVIH